MTRLQELRRVLGDQDHLLKPTHEAEGGRVRTPPTVNSLICTHTKNPKLDFVFK